MAGTLKGGHALEGDRVPDVDVGRGRVDAELDPQRSSLRKLALELSLGKNVDRVADQFLDDGHRRSILGGPRTGTA